MRRIPGIGAMVLALAAGASASNANVINGMVNAGSNGNGFEQSFADAWNDSSEFSCTNSSPFTVTATSGPCAGQSVIVMYEVNGSPANTSSFSHTFSYEVFCHNNGELRHNVGFDGKPRASIQNGTYSIDTDPPEGLTATTFTAAFNVPTLGEWGMIAMVAGLLACGIFVILRR